VDDQNTARPSSSPPLKVLVVDDKPDNAKTLSFLLRLDGYDARPVYSGVESIEAAESFAPDIVFLDLGLPVMDGYQVAERLRRMTGLKDTMLVALTGYPHSECEDRYQQAGFDHHLLKPAELSEIQGLLLQVAERKAARERFPA